jgi:hypothetical protein
MRPKSQTVGSHFPCFNTFSNNVLTPRLFRDSGEPHSAALAMRTPLDSIIPSRGPNQSRNESRQRLYQPPLYDKRLTYGSSEPVPPSNAGRSTQRLEQSRSPYEVHDRILPSPVIYRPAPAFSTQAQLSYDRSATLAPIRRCSGTSGGLSSYSAPSFEKQAVDSSHPPPTELSEEDRTLPPIREALSFLSWSDHPEAMPLFTRPT